MAIVNYTVGKELSTERIAAMRAEVRAAAERPYTYDPDSPLLTEAQLAEFRPVNFATETERLEAMRRVGIIDKTLSEDFTSWADVKKELGIDKRTAAAV
jgi:hypothetical protein